MRSHVPCKLAIAVLCLLATPVVAEDVIVKNATIWTISGKGILAGADLLVRDGKIVAVGPGLKASSSTVIIDGSGKHVTPGLIDAHSHTGVDGAVNEGANNITAEVRIGDVLDPDSIAIYRELAGGLTVANVLHGSADSIGGQNQVIKLKWGVTAEQLKFPGAPPGIKFALGENPKRSNFSFLRTPRYPSTRMGVEQSIRERFLAARRYEQRWREYDRLRPRQKAHTVPPRKDLQLEAIAQILDGERLVHSHCYQQNEILMLIRLAEQFGFRIATFQHVLEGYKVADEIARHGAGASTFSDWWAYKLEAYDAIPYNGALMAQRGVVVSFNSDSNELARHLNTEAAKAMKYGDLPAEEAIKFVTINPARQLGIDDRVGSLEPGKDADFVVWSGNPLSVYTIAEQTWVDGEKQFDRREDLDRRKDVERERAELIEKIKSGDKKPEISEKEEEEADKAAQEAEKGPGKTAVQKKAPHDEEERPAGRPIPPARPLVYTDRSAVASPAGLAITGATIHTVSGPVIEGGTVVVEAGRITAVGRRAPIPEGARVIRAAGLHLYPGLIDASTVLGLTEIGSVRGSVDTSEVGKINSNLRVEASINPASELLPVTRANGITHVLTAPRGGIISGTSALIRLDGWTWEDLTAAAPVTMHVNYPAYPRTGGRFFFGPPRSKEEQEKQRKADLELLNKTIEDARAYRKAKQAGSTHLEPDTALEAMLPVLEGRIPVMVDASEIRQIKDAIAWSRKEGLRMILESSVDVWRVTDLLVENDIPVIIGPVLSTRFREDEPYDTAYTVPLKLHEAGVRFCIVNGGGGFGASNTRNLPYQAGMAAAFGLPRDIALKAITLYPAQILEVADDLGSIEAGKSASFILTNGDPLEIRTKVLREFIDGREVDLSNKHRRLYEKYRARPSSGATR
ncbi:MAG: amidohydrolase family protein [Acidobacteriota bacterium]